MRNILNKRFCCDLTKQDTLLLKGVAITFIILHNFCRWLPNSTLENEFTFNLQNTKNWIENILNGGPHLFLNIFSFWGHYGVSIFLFLSGFGLVKKYESESSPKLITPYFMANNAKKLWKLLIGGAICYMIINNDFLNIWIPILFTFTSNLHPTRNILYGPWWFFSLIMQCYFIYAVFIYKKKTLVANIIIGLSILTIILAPNIIPGHNLLHYIKYNALGWMLPFCQGIIMARHKITIPLKFSFMAFILFLLCELNFYSWLLAPFFFNIAILPLIIIKKSYFRKTFEWIGVISASIFVFHPIIRPYFLTLSNNKFIGAIYLSILGYVIASLFIAFLYQKILNKFTK